VHYQDKLYINNGEGEFTNNPNSLPGLTISGSKVKASDFDGDGDLDLFIAGRHNPWEYPQPTSSFMLLNEGGIFRNVTAEVAPDLLNIGMVTDAVWSDYDNDSDKDLVLVGEWMPMTILANNQGKFDLVTTATTLNKTTGWWSSIAEADLNNDGKMDYITGNLGLNYRYHASDLDPFLVYSADFDNNGSVDIVLGYDSPEHSYPIRGRQCSSQQSSFVLDKFPDYQSFANATMADIYGQEALDNSYKMEVNSFQTTVWIQGDNKDFNAVALPNQAQISSVNNILVIDFNKDEQLDLIISGNLYSSEEESPRNDAAIGLLLTGNGKGQFEAIPPIESGFSTFKDVKDMALLPSNGCTLVVTVSNDDRLQAHNLCLE
jgi:hypothetical protein